MDFGVVRDHLVLLMMLCSICGVGCDRSATGVKAVAVADVPDTVDTSVADAPIPGSDTPATSEDTPETPNDTPESPEDAPAKETETPPGPDISEPAADTWMASALPPVTTHLAERAQEWAETRKCALSCHTTIPFLLADPLKTADSKAVAEIILKPVRERVKAWPEVTPFYPSQPQGTEAVLNAVALVHHDVKLGGVLTENTCKALEAMWNEQTQDGSFAWWAFSLLPFEVAEANLWGAALVELTLAAVAQPSECAAASANAEPLLKLRTWLKEAYKTADMHARVWALLAHNAGSGELLSPEENAALLDSLQEVQREDGGFGLLDLLNGEGAIISDAYATAIASAVLRGSSNEAHKKAAQSATDWMASANSLKELQKALSPNKPEKEFNNALYGDTAVAYWLWFQHLPTE